MWNLDRAPLGYNEKSMRARSDFQKVQIEGASFVTWWILKSQCFKNAL